MDNPGEEDRAARIRQARQVLAGSDITPPNDPIGFGDRFAIGGSGELRYLLVVAALIVGAAVVWALWGMLPASAVLFVLALALLAGWFVL